jgi:hypothetical protein
MLLLVVGFAFAATMTVTPTVEADGCIVGFDAGCTVPICVDGVTQCCTTWCCAPKDCADP